MRYVVNIITQNKWSSVLTWIRTERGWEKLYVDINGMPQVFDDLNKAYRIVADSGVYQHTREVIEYHE